jgi:hypothetical protein
MLRYERLQLPQYVIEMKTHCLSGSFRPAQGDCA